MPKFIFYTLLFLFTFNIRGQQKNHLHKPLDIPLYLSGTFGELRSNHFHSGLDIKTQGREGLNVYALDDGYVYRIKISTRGYGKALYIKHPSGIISVYGHLKYFNDNIEAYIKRKQYKKKSFEIEVFPYEIELPIKKGELIAYSGNTGGSSGAHLHFEIRNSEEHPLNPMSFGIVVEDTIHPFLKKLFAYSLDSNSHINQMQGRMPVYYYKKNDSIYQADSITAYGQIGFGVEVYDYQNNSYNKNGVYKIQVLVNGIKVYEHIMEELDFFKSHYINTMIDYEFYKSKYKRVQKLFVEPYNLLEIYTQLLNEGKISIKNKKNYYIQIIVSDYNNNSTYINIPVYGLKTEIVEKKKKQAKTPYFVKAGERTDINLKDMKIIFQKNSAYYDFYLNYKPIKNGFIINNITIPIHKPMIFKYDISNVPISKRKYIYLSRLGYKNKKYYIGSEMKNDTLIGYSKHFGTFKLSYDSIPPRIFPFNFKPKTSLTNYKFLSFEIFDKETGIASYDAYIDGKWILMEYDYKKNRLTYNFSDMKLKGYKHSIKVVLKDRVGNNKTFFGYFFRK